jgi:hypothetical protein
MVSHGTDVTTVRTDPPRTGTVTTLPRRTPGASLRPVPGPTARRPLVASFNRGAYDKAFGRLQPQGDRIGQPHANRAFGQGDDWDNRRVIPLPVPGQRGPSGGSAA